MIHTKQELLQLLHTNASMIKNYGVDKLFIFGSFRHDRATKKSDVDFLVDFLPQQKTYNNLFYLYEFLQSKTGRKVEVLTRAGLSKYIGPHIIKDLEDVAL